MFFQAGVHRAHQRAVPHLEAARQGERTEEARVRGVRLRTGRRAERWCFIGISTEGDSGEQCRSWACGVAASVHALAACTLVHADTSRSAKYASAHRDDTAAKMNAGTSRDPSPSDDENIANE